MDVVKYFQCTRCEHQARHFGSIIKHYQAIHSTEAGFRVVCGVDGCCRDYSDILYLCRHMRSKHVAFYKEHMQSSDREPDLDESFCALQPAESTVQGIHPCKKVRLSADQIAFDYVASLSLKMREVKKVPASLCQEVRHDIGFMLASSRESLRDDMTQRLMDLNASSDVMSVVHDLLSSASPFEVACETLQTDRDINKYVEDNFGYVQPVQYRLGDGSDDSTVEYMQYVPVLDTLKTMTFFQL